MPRRIGDHRSIVRARHASTKRPPATTSGRLPNKMRFGKSLRQVIMSNLEESVSIFVRGNVGRQENAENFLEARRLISKMLLKQPETLGTMAQERVFCSNCLQKFVEIRPSCRFDSSGVEQRAPVASLKASGCGLH